jgi:CheY-like chemotaxis protein/HPt (histidine-containing phosphotransfer) domain-containing protein
MDAMHATYFEEMDELLQRAEECLIRLESGRGADDIHELFRIAHSIKGSSQMIGYEPIGALTHRMEDLLDSVRKERIRLDGEVLRLCFDALDHVRAMTESRKLRFDEDFDRDAIAEADRLGGEIGRLLGRRPEPDDGSRNAGPAGDGIVGSLKAARNAASRRYYISVRFSDDAPMLQAILYMIFHNIREIGALEYSTVSDEDIFGEPGAQPVTSCAMMLRTELEASELYPYFDVMYVDRIEIVDLSDETLSGRSVPRDRTVQAFFETVFGELRKLHPLLFGGRKTNAAGLEEALREHSANIAGAAGGLPPGAVPPAIGRFCELGLLLTGGSAKLRKEQADLLRRAYADLLETVYGHVRGRMIFQNIRARDGQFRKRLGETAERMDRSKIRRLFVDVGGLSALDEDDLAELIAVRRNLGGAGIPVDIIAGRPLNRRIVNIFDAIRPEEPFDVYGTELEAVLGISPEIGRSGRDGDMENYRVMIVGGAEASANLKKTLESAGFRRVDAFSDPGEAMAALEDRKYHIVLADMDARGMDGLKFLAGVKQRDPMSRVIMMTEDASVDRVLGCLELGAVDCLIKPFDMKRDLLEAVARSAGELERWNGVIRTAVLRRTGAAAEDRADRTEKRADSDQNT